MKITSKKIGLEKQIMISTLLICSIILTSAILLGKILNAPPCELCMYQRIPYFIVIFILLISLTTKVIHIIKPRNICLINGLLIMSSGGIAIYHTGVEKGYFETGCAPTGPPNFSLEIISEALKSPIEPLCNSISIELFGISMAGYNAIISFLLSFLLIYLCFNNYYWMSDEKE